MNLLRPYFLYTTKSPVEGNSQNSEGDFEEGTSPEWFFVGRCRDDKNSAGKRIQLVNGENIQYDSIIYVDTNTPIILEYSEVIVTAKKINDLSVLKDAEFIKRERSTGLIRLIDKVKDFDKKRLNLRIWV